MRNPKLIYLLLGAAAIWYFIKNKKVVPSPNLPSDTGVPPTLPQSATGAGTSDFLAEDRAMPLYDPKHKPTDNTQTQTPGDGSLAGLY